jgi:hypothetical protein
MHIWPRKAAEGVPAARPPSGGGPGGLLAVQPARAVRKQVNTAPGECVAVRRLVNGGAEVEFPRFQVRRY